MPEEVMRAYCLPCKDHKNVPNPQLKRIDGVRGPRLQKSGKCPDCGRVVNRFVHVPDEDEDENVPVLESEPETEQNPSEPETPRTVWIGACRRCEGSEFKGEYIGRRFDGANVVNAVCLACEAPQVLIGAEVKDAPEAS